MYISIGLARVKQARGCEMASDRYGSIVFTTAQVFDVLNNLQQVAGGVR